MRRITRAIYLLVLLTPLSLYCQNSAKPDSTEKKIPKGNTAGAVDQSGSAQSNEPLPINAPPVMSAKDRDSLGVKRILSSFEFWLSLEVLTFGLLVCGLQYFLLRKKGITAEETLRVFGLNLIITGTLFAITAGFDSNQIAPAMGLFGTIAGYILGKREGQKQQEKEETK